MRAGTRRLVLLAVKSPANEVAKRLTTQQKLVLSDNPHGSVAALFADCVNCAADSLINEAGGPAWDADGVRAAHRARPAPAARRHLRGGDRGRGDPAGRPRRPHPPRRPAQPRPRSPPPTTSGGQLDGLIYPGFLTAAGAARLPVARPVPEGGRPPPRQAARQRRPRRAADGGGPPGTGRVPRGAGRRCCPMARTGEAATEIRWQIEELRVSLFAQTMRTPLPVSERRIMTAIEQLS